MTGTQNMCIRQNYIILNYRVSITIFGVFKVTRNSWKIGPMRASGLASGPSRVSGDSFCEGKQSRAPGSLSVGILRDLGADQGERYDHEVAVPQA